MTEEDKALVERLRQGHEGPAANRIEELSAENERLRAAMGQVSIELYDVAEFMDQASVDAQTLEAKNEWLRKALGEVLVYAPDFMHGMPKKHYEKIANGSSDD